MGSVYTTNLSFDPVVVVHNPLSSKQAGILPFISITSAWCIPTMNASDGTPADSTLAPLHHLVATMLFSIDL